MTPAQYLQAHRDRFVAELAEFLRYPSVSVEPGRAGDVRRCAAWLARHLAAIGLDEARATATGGHPIVSADWLRAPGQPTVLVYGHYDVQPPDPLDAWSSPPFEPAVRGANLYARGAADDKGQMFVHVKALESHLRTTGGLPVNVKCLFEGEEEIGSPHLPAFIVERRRALRADVAVVSDMRMLGPERPALTESLRGALSVEVRMQGQRKDLHSGNFGGVVHNPVQALCDVLSSLHDARGRVAIPGFYDRVRGPTAEEREYMAAVGPSDLDILTDAGAARGWGEPGYSLYERTSIRPSLTITGVTGGYQGPGGKAVIPSHARATLDVRLVEDQDPADIDARLRRFVHRIARPTVIAQVRTLFRAHPARVRRDHPATRAAAAAYRAGFGVSPVFVRVGGTIPVVHSLQRLLGVPTVMMGFALPDSDLHAPNEKLHLPTFFRAIRTSIHFLNELSKPGSAAWASSAPRGMAAGGGALPMSARSERP
jgi:acetylornithine deacetylase/succinyl-diaminopimelate desuccinylase-like protein